MYNQFVKTRENYISVHQIKRKKILFINLIAPSTLDLRTQKDSQEERKETLEIETEIRKHPLSLEKRRISQIHSVKNLDIKDKGN